ncbi:MAG: hypothetical protein ACREOP_15620 [Thermodesulfobacteriota bacterium]
MKRRIIFILMIPLLSAAASCYDAAEKETSVMKFPVSDPGEFKALDAPVIDRAVTSDGNGSLYVDAGSPVSVALYTVDGAGFEHARASYKAMLRTEGLTAVGDSKGIAYLEMKVRYPGGEELVSRGPAVPPTGTTGWMPGEAVIYPDKGVTPESVSLVLVVDGKGKVWIDDVVLLTQPLRLEYLFWGHAVVWIVLIIYIYSLLGKQRRVRSELAALGKGS